ncbi:MAG: EAL domain-containing protein [Thermoanaerobaculia bacterium]
MIPAIDRDAEVRDLLRRGFYAIAFQPIFRLADGEFFGFEGLLRGPKGTLLAQPARIFGRPLITRELMHDIDTACIHAAVRSGRILAANHQLFVNVHGETLFRFADRMEELLELLELLALDPARLVLEISETTDKSHVRSIARSIVPLRRRGVTIALDDVGARYAWLHHMMWLEPEYLKIDRIFVSRVDTSNQKRKLMGAIAKMAETMGCRVVVEGVEREEERRMAQELGIEFGQGYLIGKPMPAQTWVSAEACSVERNQVAGLWK